MFQPVIKMFSIHESNKLSTKCRMNDYDYDDDDDDGNESKNLFMHCDYL